MLRHVALVLVLVFPFSKSVSQAPAAPPIVIANVNVLPMDRERVLARQTVVIEGGIITRMGAAEDVPIPVARYELLEKLVRGFRAEGVRLRPERRFGPARCESAREHRQQPAHRRCRAAGAVAVPS